MERDLKTAAPSLGGMITRRRMLGVTGGALAVALLAGCAPGESGGAGTPASSGRTVGATSRRAEGIRGVVFNTSSQDVTLFDRARMKLPVAARPTQ